jgi:hypothetical protein
VDSGQWTVESKAAPSDRFLAVHFPLFTAFVGN